jgi:hypothetical protein
MFNKNAKLRFEAMRKIWAEMNMILKMLSRRFLKQLGKQ